MLAPIETHKCGVCGRNDVIVTTYNISDGQYFQMCKECQRSALSNIISRFSEDDIKNVINILTNENYDVNINLSSNVMK